ncbi:MAG: ABC transporter substrate-binding protein [Syntrophomonadaceae bacterium]|nr:ABC transporter substrate-binding protein [Syntrophomonadaceae bacterium]MDD3023224.1 ABC transporter substrate-binding protein [Syntrophomonadaceae bacterium]
MRISVSDKIGDIMSNYPELYEAFWESGFPCGSAAELVDLLGKDTMLLTALRVKDINVELFTSMLNGRVDCQCQMEGLAYDFYNPDLPVNLLVKTACPISMLFKDRLIETLRAHQEQTGKITNTFIVDGCHAPHAFEKFWEPESIDELPDIIMSMSFDELYDKRFIDKYVSRGYFSNILKGSEQAYSHLDCMDESYTLNAGLAMVFLIDEKNLGDLPVPRKWEDLLNPIYKGKIIAFGDEFKEIFEYPLYYLYKEFGMESMRKLANNTKGIYHAAKAAKLAGTNSREAGAIYYLPLTFARLCENQNVSIVFPEDGALIIPIAFLIKKDKIEELDYLAEFILNNYGQMCADINAAVFNPRIESKIPEGIRLKWLGWDYIKSNDILAIGQKLRQEFHQAWKKDIGC